MDKVLQAVRDTYAWHLDEINGVSCAIWPQLARALWFCTRCEGKPDAELQQAVADLWLADDEVRAALCTGADGRNAPMRDVKRTVDKVKTLRLAERHPEHAHRSGKILKPEECVGLPPKMDGHMIVDSGGNVLLPKELWPYYFARAAIKICADTNLARFDPRNVITAFQESHLAAYAETMWAYPSNQKVRVVMQKSGEMATLARALSVAHAQYDWLMSNGHQALVAEYAPLIASWTPMFADNAVQQGIIDGLLPHRSIVLHRDDVHTFLKRYTLVRRIKIVGSRPVSTYGCGRRVFRCHRSRHWAKRRFHSTTSTAMDHAHEHLHADPADAADQGAAEVALCGGGTKSSSDDDSDDSTDMGDSWCDDVTADGPHMEDEEPSAGSQAPAAANPVAFEPASGTTSTASSSGNHTRHRPPPPGAIKSATESLVRRRIASRRMPRDCDCQFVVNVSSLLSGVLPYVLVSFTKEHSGHTPGPLEDDTTLGYHRAVKEFLEPFINQVAMPPNIQGMWSNMTELCRRWYCTAVAGSPLRGAVPTGDAARHLASADLAPPINSHAAHSIGFSPPRALRCTSATVQEAGKRLRGPADSDEIRQVSRTTCRCMLTVEASTDLEEDSNILACCLRDDCVGAKLYHRWCLAEDERVNEESPDGWLCPECMSSRLAAVDMGVDHTGTDDGGLKQALRDLACRCELAANSVDDTDAVMFRSMARVLLPGNGGLDSSSRRLRPRTVHIDNASPTVGMSSAVSSHDHEPDVPDLSSTTGHRRRSQVLDFAVLASTGFTSAQETQAKPTNSSIPEQTVPANSFSPVWDYNLMLPHNLVTDDTDSLVQRFAQTMDYSYSGYFWTAVPQYLQNRRSKTMRRLRGGLRNDDKLIDMLKELSDLGWAKVDAQFRDNPSGGPQPLSTLQAVIVTPQQRKYVEDHPDAAKVQIVCIFSRHVSLTLWVGHGRRALIDSSVCSVWHMTINV